jgi:hypothetical protein
VSVTELLQKHPLAAAAATSSGLTLVGFCEGITPVLQVVSLLVSIAIGLLAILRQAPQARASLQISKSMNHWLKAIFAAFIAGAAGSLVVTISDPAAFDLAKLKRALFVAIVTGIIGAAGYVMRSPLPADPPAATTDVQSPGQGASAVTKLLIVALAIGFLCTGCAGTSADRDFRSKVKSVNVGGTVSTDGQQTTGGFTTTFELRDPDAAGLRK